MLSTEVTLYIVIFYQTDSQLSFLRVDVRFARIASPATPPPPLFLGPSSYFPFFCWHWWWYFCAKNGKSDTSEGECGCKNVGVGRDVHESDQELWGKVTLLITLIKGAQLCFTVLSPKSSDPWQAINNDWSLRGVLFSRLVSCRSFRTSSPSFGRRQKKNSSVSFLRQQ